MVVQFGIAVVKSYARMTLVSDCMLPRESGFDEP